MTVGDGLGVDVGVDVGVGCGELSGGVPLPPPLFCDPSSWQPLAKSPIISPKMANIIEGVLLLLFIRPSPPLSARLYVFQALGQKMYASFLLVLMG